MRRAMVIMMVSAVVFAGLQLANAEEELFDTKAAVIHIEKGITHLKEKKYDDAVEELEEAVTINPDAEAYYYLGYAYYMKGREGNDAESRKKSIESFDKAYELDPGFTPSRFKPADAGEAIPEPKASETKPSSAPPVQSEPTVTSPEPQPDQQTSGADSPAQPTPPIKAAD
jgi:tetratricopeptide (TPR) repeat protein